MFARAVTPEFGRREPRLRARSYLLGLVPGLERKNGWMIAEARKPPEADASAPALALTARPDARRLST